MNKNIKFQIGQRELSIDIKKVASLADNSCLLRYGDTVILTTLVSKPAEEKDEKERNFLPLLVEYQEKAYAAGKIPGGFIKREGKPSDKEITTARLIDRATRPLIDQNFRDDIHIINTVLSMDDAASLEIVSLLGTIAVLYSSKIPFDVACGAVRVALLDNKFVINPTAEELKKSPLDLIVAGTYDKFVMIEGIINNLPERIIIDALEEANKHIRKIIEEFYKIRQENKVKVEEKEEKISPQIENFIRDALKEVIFIEEKQKRNEEIDRKREEVLAHFSYINSNNLKHSFEKILKNIIRESILKENRRCDGRTTNQLRKITCQVGILPRAHGSALFTRGQTQALVVTTLGTTEDEQLIDDIEKKEYKQFMVHYNFLPFSVNEIKPLRAPLRREIGHGMLVEKALSCIIPGEEKFPYTIRIVSDILESNGSTSMATVCGATLSLLDAGVPIKNKVAGISIGLVKEEENYALLTDIIGLEDEYGDMDFKIAGTENGLTALQLDIKIKGIEIEIIKGAFSLALEARRTILDKMNETISAPRSQLSKYAPRVVITYVNADKIRNIIGPAGKTIKNIINETGVKLEIEDTGKIKIISPSEEAMMQALEMIEYLTAEAEVGRIYLGKVTRITHFGAFVEILPGKEGLLHISQLEDRRVERVDQVLQEGDTVLVKLISIDEYGRMILSRKAAMKEKMKEKEKQRIR